MIIANPIFDTVFKKLMENDKVVKFFIGTLLNENVVEVHLQPQEYTYEGEFEKDDPNAADVIAERYRKRQTIWLYRLDFIATIKTESGEYRKVLIEIQKARSLLDVMKFRNYLLEEFKKEDFVNNIKTALPITTIYVLGFNLPEIDSACVKVDRSYIDLINNVKIEKKSEFVEKLTHESFIVQIQRITDRFQTRLDKLLSIFEQKNFEDDRGIIKSYYHQTDIEELKIITDILHHAGTDPQDKKRIENEQEALRIMDAYFGEKERRLQNSINQKTKEIEEKTKVIEEKDKALEIKDKVIEENIKVIEEKDKIINDMISKYDILISEIEKLKQKIKD